MPEPHATRCVAVDTAPALTARPPLTAPPPLAQGVYRTIEELRSIDDDIENLNCQRTRDYCEGLLRDGNGILRWFISMQMRIPQEQGTPLYIDSASTVFVAQSRGAVKKSAWIRRRAEVLTEAFDMGLAASAKCARCGLRASMCNAGVSRIFCSMGIYARKRLKVVRSILLHSCRKTGLKPSRFFFLFVSNLSSHFLRRHAFHNRLLDACT